MTSEVLLSASSTPSQEYGILQYNDVLRVFTGCCGAKVNTGLTAVICEMCGTGRSPKRVDLPAWSLSEDGRYTLAPSYGLTGDLTRLDWWVEAWTGLKVKVSVEA